MYRIHDENHVVLIENVWPKIKRSTDMFAGKDVETEPHKSDLKRTQEYLAWVESGNTPLLREG